MAPTDSSGGGSQDFVAAALDFAEQLLLSVETELKSFYLDHSNPLEIVFLALKASYKEAAETTRYYMERVRMAVGLLPSSPTTVTTACLEDSLKAALADIDDLQHSLDDLQQNLEKFMRDHADYLNLQEKAQKTQRTLDLLGNMMKAAFDTVAHHHP